MIYNRSGNRKYLNAEERKRFIEAARGQRFPINTLCLTLAYTGARISEVLSLTAGNIDTEAGVIVIESLKKRRRGVFRHVPVPDTLLVELAREHRIRSGATERRLWPMSRTTAWKKIKTVMIEAAVPSFCASPKGLRHAFGVAGIVTADIPLNLMQRWLGHSRIETTAIYANAVGPEERAIATRMWVDSESTLPTRRKG